MQNRIFSTDSAKAIKAQSFGFVNAIHYLAPSTLSGKNLCSHASIACITLCLGWESGQAGMVAHDDDMNSVRLSRIAKAQRFMRERALYIADMVRAIDLLLAQIAIANKKNKRRAKKLRKALKRLCVRLNGSSDIAWEGIRFVIERGPRGKVSVTLNNRDGRNFFEHFPEIDFVDYTKNPARFDRALPANYHLVFSRSETNEADCIRLLSRGVNVAAVFASKPVDWKGFIVIDGDRHDLRQLDPRGPRGFVIGLSPKGRKAKADRSGFVIR
jgi:hypothetical protein